MTREKAESVCSVSRVPHIHLPPLAAISELGISILQSFRTRNAPSGFVTGILSFAQAGRKAVKASLKGMRALFLGFGFFSNLEKF